MRRAISGGFIAALAFAALAAPPAEAAKRKPDLIVSSVSADATAELGEVLAITDSTKNKGKRAAAPSTTALFLSSDEQLDGGDVELSPSRDIGRLKSTKSSAGETSADVPPTVPTGDYRVIACADSDDAVREKREGNNCTASAGTTAVEDTVAPAAPEFTGTTPASPANDNNPILNGNAEDESTVTLYGGLSCAGSPLATTIAGAGTFAFGRTVADDQTNGFTATATDAAGNDSPCSTLILCEEDSTAPDAPIGLHTLPGSPADDARPFVNGSAETGTTVDVYAASACAGGIVGSGEAAGLSFSIQVTAVAYNSTTQFTATATDPAGNVSGCAEPVEYVNALETEVEANDTTGQANPIPASGLIQGVGTPSSDLDVFSFTIPPGPSRSARIETFNLDSSPCTGATDTVVELLDPAGSVMIGNDDKDVDRCSKIDGITSSNAASNLTPGTYYVRVRPFDSGATSPYLLELELSP